MIVHVGSILHAYTHSRSEIELPDEATVGDALNALEQRFSGIRFRIVDEQGHIRTHMRVFVGSKPVQSLAAQVPANGDVHVLGALSGG